MKRKEKKKRTFRDFRGAIPRRRQRRDFRRMCGGAFRLAPITRPDENEIIFFVFFVVPTRNRRTVNAVENDQLIEKRSRRMGAQRRPRAALPATIGR